MPNVSTPMLVMLTGIMTLVRRYSTNAPSPRLVTGRKLIAPGMVTAPPEPVYPVMAIMRLLVV